QNSNLPEGRTEEPAPGWLRILDIELSDSGIYVCSASNIHGTVTAAVRLNVQVAPSFVTEPVSHTVEAGSPVTMTCTVTGVPDPYVTWLTPNNVVYEVPSGEMNGISVSSDGIFYINNANINDAGVYTCTATNAVGTVYTTATLDVLSMPTFTYSQENQRVNEGTSILLKCRADGNPKPTMSWFYNGIQLETNAQYDVYFSGDLRIHNIEKTQDGIYVCRAENTMGSIQHAVYIIILVAPTFMLRPLDLIVDLGSTVMINCTADGFPAPVLEWQKDGQVLSVDYNVHVFGNHTIKIDGVQEINLGAYTCIASNEAGHNRVTGNLWTTAPSVPLDVTGVATSDYILLTWNAAEELNASPDIPVFGIKPYNTSVNISESVTLQCQAHSREPAVITWYRSDFHANKHYQIGDGFVHLTTPGANSYVTGSGDLVVLDARKIDAGWYLCEAANSVGVITGTLYLTINMPPEIYYVTSPLRGTEGGMAYLQCYSYGTPKPDITWNDQDGELIEPLLGRYDITANSLLIHSLSMLDDSGNYTCHASNMLGDDLAVLTLFIQGLPVLDGITVTHDDIKKTIICHSLGLPEPSISWKVNDIPLNQNNILGHDVNRDYELVIYNFVAVETFMYYCWATNIFGNSTDVYVISVPKDPSLPSVIGLTASTVTLSWEDQNTLDALPTLSYNIQSKAVQAVNAFGAGAFSDPSAVVTTMQGAPLKAVDNLQITAKGTSSVLLTWQVDNIDSSLISGYVVSYRAAGNDTFTSVQLSSSSITSYVLQDLDTDTEYFIKIAYYTSGGIGPYTEEVLVKTEADLFDPSGNQSLSDDSSMSASTLGAIIGAMLAVALLLLLLAVILCRSYRSPKDEQLYARKNSNIWIASDNLYEEGASGSATKQGVYNISFASNDNYHPDDGTDGMYDFSGAAGQKRSKRGKFNVRAMTSDVMFKKRGKAPLRRWGIPETSGVILTSQTSTSEVAPVSTPITAVSHDLRNETITEVSEENGSAARQAMSASRDDNSPTPSSISHQYEYIDTSPTPRPIQKDAVYAKVEKTGKINMKIQEEQERRRKILAERERQKELDKGLRIISKEKKKEARRREKLRASADGSEDPPVNIQVMHMRNHENAALY
uniref:Hemicentin-1-like n=1 Tax=Saccoglossus kowalevskii TaxID=10224 RepID=A0ABM0MKZ6_SACKO